MNPPFEIKVDVSPLRRFINGVLYQLFRPYWLALLFWLLFLFVIPDYFQKYDLEVVRSEMLVPKGSHHYYQDMNNDGQEEMIIAEYRFPDSNHVRVLYCDQQGRVYNQWNPPGTWLFRNRLFFGDYDKDGYTEVYCVTRKGDSLFLNIDEPMQSDGIGLTGRFIAIADKYNGHEIDLRNVFGSFADTDGDGSDEYIFSMYAGFSKQPRRLYRYNIKTDELVASPLSASGIYFNFCSMDINGDGIKEITGLVPPHENHHDQTPYTDSAAWLLVVDPVVMDFAFEPRRFDFGIGSPIQPAFYRIGDKKFILMTVFGNNASMPLKYIPVFLFDTKGVILREKHIDSDQIHNLVPFPQYQVPDRMALISDRGLLIVLDTTLAVRQRRSLFKENPLTLRSETLEQLDMEHDGKCEFLWLANDANGDNFICLLPDDQSEMLEFPLPLKEVIYYYKCKVVHDNITRTDLIVMQVNGNEVFVKFGVNSLYWIRYPFYLGVYLVLFLLFWVLQKMQIRYARQKFEEEKVLINQQIALAKKQLEPHFMLNTLNNLGYIFMYEDRKEAQYLFGKFASLIHRGLEYADKSETNLSEELSFVRDFIILQSKRYEKLSYSIVVPEGFNPVTVLIPHSLVYTFVENALKHGLQSKNGEKKLDISVVINDQTAEVHIVDNGIGRARAKALGTMGTGKGLKVLGNIVRNYNKLNNRNISYRIIDLDEGTEVVVTL